MADFQVLKGYAGLKNWYTFWTQNIDYLQNITTEVETARQGQANLKAALDLKVPTSGFTAHFTANGYRMTTLGNAVNPQDAVNLQTVQSLISGGGLPSNIPVTSLNVGTATALQLYRVNAAGTAIEGVTPAGLLSADLSYYLRFYGGM